MLALFIVGLIAIATGAGLIFPPAGLIVAGFSAVLVSLAYSRGEGE